MKKLFLISFLIANSFHCYTQDLDNIQKRIDSLEGQLKSHQQIVKTLTDEISTLKNEKALLAVNETTAYYATNKYTNVVYDTSSPNRLEIFRIPAKSMFLVFNQVNDFYKIRFKSQIGYTARLGISFTDETAKSALDLMNQKRIQEQQALKKERLRRKNEEDRKRNLAQYNIEQERLIKQHEAQKREREQVQLEREKLAGKPVTNSTTYRNNHGTNIMNGEVGNFRKSSFSWTITQIDGKFNIRTNALSGSFNVVYSHYDSPNKLYHYNVSGSGYFDNAIVKLVMTSGKLSEYASGDLSRGNLLKILFTDNNGYLYKLGK